MTVFNLKSFVKVEHIGLFQPEHFFYRQLLWSCFDIVTKENILIIIFENFFFLYSCVFTYNEIVIYSIYYEIYLDIARVLQVSSFFQWSHSCKIGSYQVGTDSFWFLYKVKAPSNLRDTCNTIHDQYVSYIPEITWYSPIMGFSNSLESGNKCSFILCKVNNIKWYKKDKRLSLCFKHNNIHGM